MNIEHNINQIINQFNLDKINNHINHNSNILEAYWLNLNTINPNYSVQSTMLEVYGQQSSVIPANSLINGSHTHFTKEDFYYNNIKLSNVSVGNGYIHIKFRNIDCKYPIRIYTNRHILDAIFKNQHIIQMDQYLIKLNKHSITDLMQGNVLGGSFTIINKDIDVNQEYINIKIPIKSSVNYDIKDFLINHIDINNEIIESIDLDIDRPGEYLINNNFITKTIGLYYNDQAIPLINSDVNGWYYMRKQEKLYIIISNRIIQEFGQGLYSLKYYALKDIDSSSLSFQSITNCNIINVYSDTSTNYTKEFNYQIPVLYDNNLQNLITRLQGLYQDCCFKLKINPIVVPSTMNNIRLPVIKYNCTIFSNLNHPSLFYSISNHYQDKYLIDYQILH